MILAAAVHLPCFLSTEDQRLLLSNLQGFFAVSLGYSEGSCQFSDFTNGTRYLKGYEFGMRSPQACSPVLFALIGFLQDMPAGQCMPTAGRDPFFFRVVQLLASK